MMGTPLAAVGEFGLIERIAGMLETLNRRAHIADRLTLSIGDDGAVWQAPNGVAQVITTDALVEGVHFDLLTTSWPDLGWKSLAVNLSDVGAMGAQPELAVISLGLPRQTMVEDIEAFYVGLAECAGQFGVAVVGGDIVSSPVLTVNVTAIGSTTSGDLRRSAGKAGDVLAVTGWLGRSGGGLRLLEQGMPATLQEGGAGELIQAHVRPIPRIAAAACLVEAGLRCAMDVSDGLRGDAVHICERSGIGATLSVGAIPIHPALLEHFQIDDARRLAMDGGEDYELLCAGPESIVRQAGVLVAARTGLPLTIIGRLHERREGAELVALEDAQGRPMQIPRTSWDHFRHES